MRVSLPSHVLQHCHTTLVDCPEVSDPKHLRVILETQKEIKPFADRLPDLAQFNTDQRVDLLIYHLLEKNAYGWALISFLKHLRGRHPEDDLDRALTELIADVEAALLEAEHDLEKRKIRSAAQDPGVRNARAATDDDDAPADYEQQPWYASSIPASVEISQQQALLLQPAVDVVLMTATEVELKSVLRLLKPYPRRKHILLVYVGPETYYLGMFGEYCSVVTRCEMGAIGTGSSALAAEQALRLWKPRAAIMAGIAFGADRKKQRIGDVLVARQLIVYEPQRVGEHKTNYRGPRPESEPTLRNRFNNLQNWRFERPDGSVCRIHYGSVLSGEKLMDNPDKKAELLSLNQEAIGGEMEGAGLWSAAERLKVPWILVKAICDWGDGTKTGKHQPLAAAVAADLVHHILSRKNVLNSLPKPAV